MPNLTPIQNVIVALAAILAELGFSYLTGKNPDTPVSGDVFTQLLQYLLITLAGWNIKSARAKFAGKLNYERN